MLAGCVHSDPQDPDALKISLVNPEGSGRSDAKRDFKAGKLQLVDVPIIGLAPPDPESNDPRFSNITKQHLPVDGNHPNAGAWVRYAKAYNKTMIAAFDREVTR